jgi:cytochrome c biogenesis protein
MTNAKEKSLIDRVWDFFTSVKLAIIVFSLIALTSIIGTVIEQQASPERNIEVISKLFGKSAAPTLFSVFDAMGFMDMYHSWWFVTLLMLFAANLLICTLDRLPRIWNAVKAPLAPIEDEHLRGAPIKREVVLKGGHEKVRGAVESAVKSAGFNFSEHKEPHGYQLYGQRGNYTRLGVIVTHISIIVILAGAIIGIFLGFNGHALVPEGSSIGTIVTRSGNLTPEEDMEQRIIRNAVYLSRDNLAMAAGRLGVEEDHLRARMKRLGIRPLGFSVRCDDFEMEFYGNSDMPKEYSSVLTVIEDGKEVLTKRIEVNDPLKYKGITFYQENFGSLSEESSFLFIIKATSSTGATETFSLPRGGKFVVPGTNIEATVEDYSPALAFDQSGKPFTYSDKMNNPAVELLINDGGNTSHKWVLKRFPFTWRLSGEHTVELVDIWRSQFTGLSVRDDPGVWIVYLGCITMSIGLYVAFFMSHRKIWVRVSEEKGGTKVLVGGYANKNREGFERKIDKLVSLLEGGGK